MASKHVRPALWCAVLLFVSAPALANYQDEMAVLKAQIDLVTKRNELANALKASAENVDLPRVQAIVTDRAGAVARVIYASGLVRWLKPGDVIAEGITVRRVTTSSVVASVRGKTIPLEFYAEGQNASAASMTREAPSISIPPVPRVPVAATPGAAGASAQTR